MTTVYDQIKKLPFKVQKKIIKMAENLESGVGKLEHDKQLRKFRNLCEKYDIDIEWWAKQDAGA